MENPKIIFEDSEVLILDKPSGWIVNEAQTTGNQSVVQTWIKTDFDFPISQSRVLRSGIVHRLDKETSGLLVVAKTEKSFLDIQRQFKERLVVKKYLALVHGKVDPKEGGINQAVGRLPWRRDRFGVIPGGRESETFYKAVKYFVLPKANPNLKDYSLLEFYPKTGRTHQIRIHAKFIGHAVVGDEFYAGRKTARSDRVWCPRVFLHAFYISFTHPVQAKKVEFSSDLAPDLQTSLLALTPVIF